MSKGKNRYSPYSLLIDDVHRQVSMFFRSEGVKIPKKKRSYESSIQYLFKSEPLITQTMDTLIMAEEYLWLKSGCNVIFPHSGVVIDKLLRANMELKTSAAVHMPHESFALAMPKDYIFEGMPLPGILVTWTSAHRRDLLVGDFTEMAMGKRYAREDENKSNRVLCITYRMPDKNVINRGGNKEQIGAFRMCIPEEFIPDLLRQKTAEDFNVCLGSLQHRYAGVMGLMPDEMEIQFHVAKLVMMVGIYSNSFPHALTSGYPGTPPSQMIPRLHKTWNKQSLSLASEHKEHTDHNYHYRSWHFRQLINKKYYQGEHADKPIGSRVVFVRDSMVGRAIEPETLHG